MKKLVTAALVLALALTLIDSAGAEETMDFKVPYAPWMTEGGLEIMTFYSSWNEGYLLINLDQEALDATKIMDYPVDQSVSADYIHENYILLEDIALTAVPENPDRVSIVVTYPNAGINLNQLLPDLSENLIGILSFESVLDVSIQRVNIVVKLDDEFFGPRYLLDGYAPQPGDQLFMPIGPGYIYDAFLEVITDAETEKTETFTLVKDIDLDDYAEPVELEIPDKIKALPGGENLKLTLQFVPYDEAFGD